MELLQALGMMLAVFVVMGVGFGLAAKIAVFIVEVGNHK